MRMIGRVFAVFFLFFFFVSSVLFANLSLHARVSQKHVTLQDPFIYELEISGGNVGSIPQPTLPSLDGDFNIVGRSQQQQFTYVNNALTRSKVIQLTLVPVRTGTLTIPPAQLRFKGQQMQTDPIQVTVVDLPAGLSGKTSSPAVARGGQGMTQQGRYENLFISANLDKNQVYVGEQLRYDVSLYRRIQLLNYGYEEPDYQGFWSESLAVPGAVTVETVNARRYRKQMLFSKALFPLQPGEWVISPARVGVVLNPFDGQRVLESDPLTVSVLPLPQDGQPASFSGLVGEFSLTGVLAQRRASQNAVLSYQITLVGTGNILSVDEISYQPQARFKIYKSKVVDQIQRSDQISGKRIFDYFLIPKQPGRYSLPEFSLSYFSPANQRYETLRLPVETIEVLPVKEGGAVLGPSSSFEVLNEDIRYLKQIQLQDRRPVFWRHKGYIGFSLLLFGFTVSLLALILRERFFQKRNPVQVEKRAFKQAKEALKRIKKEPRLADVSDLQRIIIQYLSDYCATPLKGVTQDEIRNIVQSRGMSQDRLDAFLACLDSLSFLVYAPAGRSKDSVMKEGIESVETVLKKCKEL